MKADQTSGATLTGSGDKYAVAAAGASTSISAAPGRVARLIPLTGTGTVQVNDNALGDASGPIVWGPVAQVLTAAGIIALDCPMAHGISVTCGATTTCLVVYS